MSSPAVDDDLALLDVLLGVVPRAAGVGGADGHLHGGRDAPRQQPRPGVGS